MPVAAVRLAQVLTIGDRPLQTESGSTESETDCLKPVIDWYSRSIDQPGSAEPRVTPARGPTPWVALCRSTSPFPEIAWKAQHQDQVKPSVRGGASKVRVMGAAAGADSFNRCTVTGSAEVSAQPPPLRLRRFFADSWRTGRTAARAWGRRSGLRPVRHWPVHL